MASDGVMPIPLKQQDEKRAGVGKFRVLILIDSEMYQLGDDQGTFELAVNLFVRYGKEDTPFQIYNDRGEGQTRQFN